MNVNNSTINNFASQAYGNTQGLGAYNASTTNATSTNAATANSSTEKVSISDTGRAAVAKDKNNFVNAIMKAGYTREQAEARFNKLQSQQVETPTSVASTTAPKSNTNNTTAASTGTTNTSSNTSTSTNNAEAAAQNRFVQGFAKQGYSKEQAMNAYNLYANILSQGYMK